jgi:hypothetical protein
MVMFKDGLPPAFPRMSPEEAADAVLEVSGKSAEYLVALSSTSVESARFYETAPARVSASDLATVQEAVRSLARAHGYPKQQVRGGSLAFDQELTIVLNECLNILPADAADEDVWSFFTLRVCPDVALWRFPNAENSQGDIRERYERLIGKPRNVFRRAWWRGYVLGKETSSRLLEDESVGIMERPSIGGNRRLAQTVARTQLRMVDAGGIKSRQELLREAIKRLRRQMGQLSIHAIDDDGVERIVQKAFDEAALALKYTVGGAVGATSETNALARFRSATGKLWPLLEPSAIEKPWAEMAELRDRLLPFRTMSSESHGAALRIASDLERLIEGWPSCTAEERAIVHAATAYFLLIDDAIPDGLPGGLDDDDLVIDAAYAALNVVRD